MRGDTYCCCDRLRVNRVHHALTELEPCFAALVFPQGTVATIRTPLMIKYLMQLP